MVTKSKKRVKKKGVRSKSTRVSRIEQAESKIIDVDQSVDHLRALIYAKPKVGKTTLSSTAPPPILVLDCNEKGTLSIRRAPQVKVFMAERWGDIDLANWYLRTADHNFRSFVVDTVTSMANMCMRFILGREDEEEDVSPMMPSKREWGHVADLVKTKILEFRNLPMNVIFLAQERRGFSDEDDDATEVFPDVSPSIRSALTPAVDIIGRLYIKEVVQKNEKGKKRRVYERRLLIGEDERYTSGDRSNAGLPRIIRNPSLSEIFTKIKED